MFKKLLRLNSREFNLCYATGKNKFSPHLRMKMLPNQESASCAVVVPKKVLKRRIDRNQEKRRVMHALKHALDSDEVSKIIVFIHKDTTHLSYNSLIDELSNLIKK